MAGLDFLSGGGMGGVPDFMNMDSIRGNEMFGGGGSSGSSMFGNLFGGMNKFLGSDSFANLTSLGSLGLGAYGLNKSLGIAQDQLDLQQDQENRAATAQNLATNNSQSLALQMTTPGTPEHAAVQKAMAEGTYKV